MVLGHALDQAESGEFDVTLVGSLAEAVEHLADAAYDLVLLDLGLPDGVGVVNVQKVREAAADVAIVVLTGTADEAPAATAMQLGAQDYLVKGRLQTGELVRTMQRAIQRERVARRAVMRMVKELGSSASVQVEAAKPGSAPSAKPPQAPTEAPGATAGTAGVGQAGAADEVAPAGVISAATVNGVLEIASGAAVKPADDWVPIGAQLGNYLITAKLGRGGMAVVYEARNVPLDRPAAVKLLPKSAGTDARSRERFLQEAKAAARVDHPNTVGIYDVGESDRFFYIAMQLIRGVSAEQLLDRRGALPWQEATRIAADACKGLAAAHAAGFVHRDMKPANILIAEDQTVKVADFGLARALEGRVPALTGAGNVVGSPPYMSPEQCRAEPVDVRCDVYALGATYYSLLTARQPYRDAGTPLEVLSAQCNAPVPDPREVVPTVPAGCAEVVLKAMAKRREDRYGSAAEMQAGLEAVLVRSRPIAAQTAEFESAQADAGAWWKFWMWFGAGALLVAGLVVLKLLGVL
jgi:DNA-binding NarL/FixJ family response regulator